MSEIWKDIDGYEGFYQVSNYGEVRSIDRRVKNKNGERVAKGRILAQVTMTSGYKTVNLFKKNRGKICLVHRLVAAAFLPNDNALAEVNHKDENKQNNRADNLEWCDRMYNVHYGSGIKRNALKRIGKPVGEQPICQYTADGVFMKRYESALKAAEAIGKDNSAICKCANGRSKTSYGFLWKWAAE